MALIFWEEGAPPAEDYNDEYIARLEAELNESLHCGIECNCFEYDDGDKRTSLNCPEHGETDAPEVLEFETWEAALTQDLSYLLDEPATEENLVKIADTIDWYFTDTMFRHNDHDIIMTRLPDGGIDVTIVMDYDDPDDYDVDFGVNHGVDFVICVDVGCMLDPYDAATEDEFWRAVEESKKRDPEQVMRDEVGRATDEERQQSRLEQHVQMEQWAHEQRAMTELPRSENHAKLEQWLRDMVAKRETLIATQQRNAVQSRIINDLKYRAAAMNGTGTDSDETKKAESIEDILFAPIESDEDRRKREQRVPEYGNDCC